MIGPAKIDCAMECEVPAGKRLDDVPQPRHAWGDVFGCPHDGCGRWFLMSDTKPEQKPVEQSMVKIQPADFDEWVDIPGTDTQIRINGTDDVGVVWARKKPAEEEAND